MKRIYIFFSIVLGMASFMSCSDFFEQESDDVLYADKDHLNNAVDTIYSVTGILGKLQTLADRTILLGEVRGDLVSLTTEASNDLRELANFNISNDNIYNKPSDYYAVINNCNYFIAHADTALKSNRNENIFMKEYAAVKAIRAWTYLQLVLNYGRIPFVTEPLLSKEAAEAAEKGTSATLEEVCSYFISDLATIPERYNTEYPGYRTIRGVDSHLLYFPLSIVRGDLYLWRASVTGSNEDYRQAALNYYYYINERNGLNSAYPTGINFTMWMPGTSTWNSMISASEANGESYSTNGELITMIAGDSIRAEGHYSELRNLFTSREENDYKVSISPSTRMMEISASQANCCISSSGTSAIYAPQGLSQHRSGDLRLSETWSEGYHRDRFSGERIETQTIDKHASSRNVHIYRRTMVYLRMAEALNMAGYPRMAFCILSTGLSNRQIRNQVMPFYDTESKTDSIFLSKFDFNDSRYALVTTDDVAARQFGQLHNMMGIHSRGSGWTPMNEHYVLPNDTIELDLNLRSQLIKEQQTYVDSLILDENALEFAFEGTRYYDIMRYSLRQKNPGETMVKLIGARMGESETDRRSMTSIVSKLADQNNWYLNWKGKIGF